MLSALSGSHSDIFYSRMFDISYQDAEKTDQKTTRLNVTTYHIF